MMRCVEAAFRLSFGVAVAGTLACLETTDADWVCDCL